MSEIIQDPGDLTPGGETDPTTGPLPGEVIPDREKEARNYRVDEAERARLRDPEPRRNRNNGEEQELRNERGLSYAANATKGMPHDGLGEVSPRFRATESPYKVLLDAVNSEDPADFARIPTGTSSDIDIGLVFRPFVDPQAGLALDLEGPDAPTLSTYRGTLTPEPILFVPRFPTAELASDMGELYLMSLLRDVPVEDLQTAMSTNADVERAVGLMNQFSQYRGPVDPETGKVTARTLFRGGNVLSRPRGQDQSANVGELGGPYLSQFLVVGSRLDDAFPPQRSAGEAREAGASATGVRLRREDGQVLFGTLTINQKQFEVRPGLDFVTDYERWLLILQGVRPDDPALKRAERSEYTGERRFVYSLRQLSEYVHRDQTIQEGVIAALLIISMNERAERLAARLGPAAPSLFNPGNAYADVGNQTGFGTFGNGHVLALLSEANTRAIKAAWSGKWVNHRWLRPEVLGGRIHNVRVEAVKPSRYNLNPEITGVPVDLRSDVEPGKEIMEWVAERNKEQNAANGRPRDASFLLSQAYPEGSPLHPTYPAGHAAQIAAEVTVLKGLFNEAFPITDSTPPVPDDQIPADLDVALVPNADGTALVPFRPGRGEPNEPLTLGGELNKLAANVALARSLAGVHFRIDYSESVLLGEYVGLGILQEQARSYNQARRSTITRDDPFFFELTLFSGIRVRILADGQIVTV